VWGFGDRAWGGIVVGADSMGPNGLLLHCRVSMIDVLATQIQMCGHPFYLLDT